MNSYHLFQISDGKERYEAVGLAVMCVYDIFGASGVSGASGSVFSKITYEDVVFSQSLHKFDIDVSQFNLDTVDYLVQCSLGFSVDIGGGGGDIYKGWYCLHGSMRIVLSMQIPLPLNVRGQN